MQPPSTLQRSAVLAACADMIRACGLALVELAQELGQPLQAAPVALPPGERSDLTNRPRLQAALQLADKGMAAYGDALHELVTYKARAEALQDGMRALLEVHA